MNVHPGQADIVSDSNHNQLSGNVRKPVILFVAEAVTLAHVARPAVLAQALDHGAFDVFFATDPRYNALFPELADFRHDIWSISSQEFLKSLARGSPVYNKRTLVRYVEEDLMLIDAIRPDLIVGDFRLSLSVSARLRQIPYATITNVYWSEYSSNRYTVPQLPMTRFLGVPLSQIMFHISRPLAFGLHCIPLNSVRRHYGLESLGHDLRRIYTDADEVLLADLPDYFPITAEAKHHRYLGPVPWSPRVKKPSWWWGIDNSRPIVYLTLGSSGVVELLPIALEALSVLPVTVIATTAGRTDLSSVPENALVSDYIPGDEAAGMAALVVCNGGSLTTYQAIQGGTPVLGIPSNLDQHLNMSYLVDAGIGEVLRSERAGVEGIRQAVKRLLERSDYRDAAMQARRVSQRYNPQERFPGILHEILGSTA
jgi:UDP:flavonoid glycosyltransferase YjiC (YdhE family)